MLGIVVPHYTRVFIIRSHHIARIEDSYNMYIHGEQTHRLFFVEYVHSWKAKRNNLHPQAMVNQVSISIQNAISDSDGPDKDCCSPKLASSSASSRNSWPSLNSLERSEDPNEIRHLLFFAYEGTSHGWDSEFFACMFFRTPRSLQR
jgi:hypothetical protein